MIESTTGPRPADFTDVRATNLAVVLRFVRENAPCSRADIAASTGLNKATVSSLVADLIDRRLVRETGLTENRVGRPATMLVLDGSPYAAVGIEANVDYLTAVAVDLAGRRLLSWRRSFPGAAASANQAVAAIASLARRVANRMAKEERQVLGLAVAVPGLVDVDGRVRIAPNLGWRDVDLAKDLTKALRDPGYRVQVDNDANLGALAEHRFGPFGGTANLVYLTGEVGVGAGVIMDGRLRRGGQGYSGELGHVQIDPAGRPAAADASAAWRRWPASVRSSAPRPPIRRSHPRRWSRRSKRSYGGHAPATGRPWPCWSGWEPPWGRVWRSWPTCSTPRR